MGLHPDKPILVGSIVYSKMDLRSTEERPSGRLRREASEENNPADILVLDFQSPELWQSRGWVLVPPATATKKPGSKMSAILWELLRVSERAANIAWVCRQQEALFHLLIEEKKEAEKNKICSWFLNPGWCTGTGSYQIEYGEQVSRLG